MADAHLLHYKAPDGTWVAIPYSVLNIYDVYVKYCNDNNITPVDETTYYSTLGNLAEYVTKLEGILGNLGNLQELVNSLHQGILPTTLGGTGKSFADYNKLIDNLKTELSQSTTLADIAALKMSVSNLDTNKLSKNVVAYGNNEPAALGLANSVTYFFQF